MWLIVLKARLLTSKLTLVLVAQLVEHKTENLGVAGSSPVQNIICHLILNSILSTYLIKLTLHSLTTLQINLKILIYSYTKIFYIIQVYILNLPHHFILVSWWIYLLTR